MTCRFATGAVLGTEDWEELVFEELDVLTLELVLITLELVGTLVLLEELNELDVLRLDEVETLVDVRLLVEIEVEVLLDVETDELVRTLLITLEDVWLPHTAPVTVGFAAGAF